jgi:hypothetical protein
MKTCYKCKEEKPFSEFHKNRTKKDGFSDSCKVCKNKYIRKYYQENKPVCRKEYLREYRKKQPAGIYTITNTANGKIYVGETARIKSRFWEHRYTLEKGKHDSIRLQTDYDQHSLDIFDFQVIERHAPDADKKLLLERERYFINKYKEEGKELYNVD